MVSSKKIKATMSLVNLNLKENILMEFIILIYKMQENTQAMNYNDVKIKFNRNVPISNCTTNLINVFS